MTVFISFVVDHSKRIELLFGVAEKEINSTGNAAPVEKEKAVDSSVLQEFIEAILQ